MISTADKVIAHCLLPTFIIKENIKCQVMISENTEKLSHPFQSIFL